MFRALDRAQMSVSGTPGTGSITLGSAVSGFQTFVAAGITNQDTFSYLVVDGTNWEYGVATYNATPGTITRAPTQTQAGNNTPISLTSAAIVLACFRGEDAILNSLPSASVFGFTANGGVATSTITSISNPPRLSVFRGDTGSSSVDQSAFRGKAVPSGSPWTATMQFKIVSSGAQFLRAGLALYDTVSGKLIINGLTLSANQPTLLSLYCANLTTYTTATGNQSIYNGSAMPEWFKIAWDGTTYTMSYSWDGSVWYQLTTYVAASFFTATHIGVGMETYNSFIAGGVIISNYFEG